MILMKIKSMMQRWVTKIKQIQCDLLFDDWFSILGKNMKIQTNLNYFWNFDLWLYSQSQSNSNYYFTFSTWKVVDSRSVIHLNKIKRMTSLSNFVFTVGARVRCGMVWKARYNCSQKPKSQDLQTFSICNGMKWKRTQKSWYNKTTDNKEWVKRFVNPCLSKINKTIDSYNVNNSINGIKTLFQFNFVSLNVLN